MSTSLNDNSEAPPLQRSLGVMSLLGAGQVIADITHTDIGKAYDCRNVDHASSILVRMLNQTDTFIVAFYAEHE